MVVSFVSLECMLKKSTAHEWLALVLDSNVSWVSQHPGSLTVAAGLGRGALGDR